MFRRFVADFRDSLLNTLTLTAWAVAVVVASLAGPFGTFEAMAPVPRSLFWVGLISTSVVLSLALASAARLLVPGWPTLGRDLLVITVFSVLFTPIVIQAILWSSGGVWLSHLNTLTLGFSVIAITAGVCLILHQLRVHLPSLAGADVAADPEPSEPRLMRRLDGVAADAILRLTVEDHYVVVVEWDGTQHRLLMRFGDAVEEMAGVDGFFVHRSHWVRRDAILRVIRQGGRQAVAMTNGDLVPVSRTYRQNLLDAGFSETTERQAAE